MVCGTHGTPCGSVFDRFCVFVIIGVWGTGYSYGMRHRVAGIIWYGVLYDMGYGVLYGIRHAWDAVWLGMGHGVFVWNGAQGSGYYMVWGIIQGYYIVWGIIQG